MDKMISSNSNQQVTKIDIVLKFQINILSSVLKQKWYLFRSKLINITNSKEETNTEHEW